MFQRPALAENPQEFQRITQISCSSPTQSTNYAKFAPFVNILDIMFQTPAPAENSQEFQRIRPHSPQITRNSHHLLTLYIIFQMPDQWQRTP